MTSLIDDRTVAAMLSVNRSTVWRKAATAAADRWGVPVAVILAGLQKT